MKFCFVCGKKNEKLIEGYCEDCYNDKFKLVKIPKDLKIFQCSKCNNIKQNTGWTDIKVEDFIKSKLKINGKDVNITIKGNKIFVSGILEHSKKIKEEVHEVSFKPTKIICSECSNRLGGYYETVLQLRGNVTKTILNFLDDEIKEKSYYSVKAVRNGYDLYVGDKNVARSLAAYLSKKYKFKISKSYRLHTRKEGVDVYKTYIFIICD
ncbi:MAG: NMD3-related protein [Candidatus Aenigmatarchaeota archaeon]